MNLLTDVTRFIRLPILDNSAPEINRQSLRASNHRLPKPCRVVLKFGNSSAKANKAVEQTSRKTSWSGSDGVPESTSATDGMSAKAVSYSYSCKPDERLSERSR